MTQAIIDNAAAISLDGELTLSTSVSNARNLQFFRQGPVQFVAEVQLNVLTADQYEPIRGAVSNGLLGPYNLQFPEEVAGTPSIHTVTVDGANQSGSVVNISSVSTNVRVFRAGQLVQFPGTSEVHIATSDAVTNGIGNGVVNLNYPLSAVTTDGATILSGNDCVFSMYLINRGRASFGPTGLVNHDGPFQFVENL